MNGNASNGANLNALRFVKVTNAFGAFAGVDLVNFDTHADGLIRAFRFTHIAVDAFVGDYECHAFFPQASTVLTRIFNRSNTEGDTNFDTSPPKVAISRTKVPDTNWNWSLGVRNTVSTSGMSWRFMPAI